MDWLKGLNQEQQEAVLHEEGPLLILAGAGSGKTTVLVARTGQLLEKKKIKAERICVLTFTNKAATELKHRVSYKIGAAGKNVWAGTFHGFGLQFLKEHWEKAGLPKKFGVIDRSDCTGILKDLLREHKHSLKDGFNLDVILEKMLILRQKRIGCRSKASLGDTPEDDMATLLAPKYEARTKSLGVVDFEDLLMRPLELIRNDAEIRESIQNRYDYLMVDEFQDTNNIQMELVDAISELHRNVAVVGDDDQSIYGWRGAEIQNILGFPKRYPNCKVVRLEQNYRSSSQILDLANSIISTNKQRHQKVLRSAHQRQGGVPELFVLEDEEAEIDHVVSEIGRLKAEEFAYKDIALLYRSNSQGGMMEGALRRMQIPYKITGGSALFDRKETKDVMAFLRSCVAPTEISFRRVVNLPPRGIGDKWVETLQSQKAVGGFYHKAKSWLKENPDENISENLSGLFIFLDELSETLIDSAESAESIIDKKLRALGYRQYVEACYKDIATADGRWLSVNIVGRILDGMFVRHGRTLKTLEKFIDCMELMDHEDSDGSEVKDEVQLMTLHACKGLEFPAVILLGLEEELLPHARLGQDVNEERRLFYVGVTRAQKQLIMTRVRQRKRYGRNQPVAASRFILELSSTLFREINDARPITTFQREDLVAKFLSR